MKEATIYVKVTVQEDNITLFRFNCDGYGWTSAEELNKEFVSLQCEDNYNGARGYTVYKKDIKICEVQKVNPYNK